MQRRDVCVVVAEHDAEEARWLALTIRRGLLLIVRAIEVRYGIGDKTQ